MKIGREFRSDEWPGLRKRLEVGEDAAWREATEMLLRHRLCDSFLDHAYQLLTRPYSGFAVLAIDCAVIEALEQFRRGVPETPPTKSGEFFRTFFRSTRFKAHFQSDDDANLFYNTLRCGILHQAEAKADSLVKRQSASYVVRRSRSSKGLTINVRRFHEELAAAVEDYVAELLAGHKALRAAFIKKMDHIASSTPGVQSVVEPPSLMDRAPVGK